MQPSESTVTSPRRRGRASMKLVLTPAEPERHYTDNHAAAARRRRCTWVLIERHNGELIPGGYYIFRFRTRLGSKTAETVRSYLHTAATGRWRWRCSRMRMASHAAPTSSRNGGAGTTASSGTSVNAMWFVSGITRPTLRTLNRAAGRIEADQLGRTAGSRSQPQGLARRISSKVRKEGAQHALELERAASDSMASLRPQVPALRPPLPRRRTPMAVDSGLAVGGFPLLGRISLAVPSE